MAHQPEMPDLGLTNSTGPQIAQNRARYTRMYKIAGLGGVVAAVLSYYAAIIVVSRAMPQTLNLAGLTEKEAGIAAGFLAGVSGQLIFVAMFLVWLGRTGARDILGAVRRQSTANGWNIAGLVTGIELIFLFLAWIDRSQIHMAGLIPILTLTVLPAMDGIVQEVFFRGFIIFRLRAAGFGPGIQVAISALAFAGLHFGYGTQSIELTSATAWIPFVGTFGFGLGLAFSVTKGNYSLLPAMIAHTLVILAAQPWLALS